MHEKKRHTASRCFSWRKWRQKGLAFCLCILWLGLFPVMAQVDEKTVAVVDDGSTVKITSTPEEAAFWEYPTMSAGQIRLQPGTLRLVNSSSKTVDFELSAIVLPYDNLEALTYLDDLWITIKEGEAVLYDNTYSRIAGEEGLSIKMEQWAPGSERVLSIWMECPFTYDGGSPSEIMGDPLVWDFQVDYDAPVITTMPPVTEASSQGPVKQVDTAQMILYIAIAVVGICLVIGIVGVVVRQLRRHKS